MISDGLSDDIPQLKTLNMVIPIPMYFCCFSLKLYSVVSRIKLRVIQRNVVYAWRQTIPDKCLTLINQTLRYKSKCIRTTQILNYIFDNMNKLLVVYKKKYTKGL